MSHWTSLPLPAGEPEEAAPSLQVYRKIRSPELQNYRDLYLALPAGEPPTGQPWPVVVMHDGQNLFDPATSYAGAWGLLGVMRTLAAEGLTLAIAGVANTGPFRKYEYSPFRDARHGGGDGERYLDFLTGTVLPELRRGFGLGGQRERTVIAGSSMGGLVSLYGWWSRPESFGGAAALSPSAWFADDALARYVADHPTPPGRLWLDMGTEEGDTMLEAARRLRDAVMAAGLGAERLRYLEDEGATHHEEHWGRRMAPALRFLLGGASPD